MNPLQSYRKVYSAILLAVVLVVVCTAARAAIDPPFQYNILDINWTAPGSFPAVTFSVTDPNTNMPYDIKTNPAFTTSGVSSLNLRIGWSTTDYTNTLDYNTTTGYTTHDPGDACKKLLPLGNGAAYPIPINALAPSVISHGDGTFTATSPCPLPLDATGTGVVGMEGHPAAKDPATGLYTMRVAVTSVVKYFSIADTPPIPRRTVVDINKCLKCHGVQNPDGTLVAPVFTFHGDNRTKEPQLCVICHNPNQTDIPFRLPSDGPETPVDFKRMVHAIHAGGFRHTSFIVIGFNHSINDYSGVRFPAKLRNCVNCHLDRDTTRPLGTFELPLGSNVLATTVDTRSFKTDPVTGIVTKSVDTDPSNDLNITPTAAVCSACHDSNEVKRHMIKTGGASFSVLQEDIDSGRVKERCVNCHGPGKDKDVRKVHEISRKTGGSGDD